jgi:hypothetical protein
MKTVDISPLFYCKGLESFMIDEKVPLMADMELQNLEWNPATAKVFSRIFWIGT